MRLHTITILSISVFRVGLFIFFLADTSHQHTPSHPSHSLWHANLHQKLLFCTSQNHILCLFMYDLYLHFKIETATTVGDLMYLWFAEAWNTNFSFYMEDPVVFNSSSSKTKWKCASVPRFLCFREYGKQLCCSGFLLTQVRALKTSMHTHNQWERSNGHTILVNTEKLLGNVLMQSAHRLYPQQHLRLRSGVQETSKGVWFRIYPRLTQVWSDARMNRLSLQNTYKICALVQIEVP